MPARDGAICSAFEKQKVIVILASCISVVAYDCRYRGQKFLDPSIIQRHGRNDICLGTRDDVFGSVTSVRHFVSLCQPHITSGPAPSQNMFSSAWSSEM